MKGIVLKRDTARILREQLKMYRDLLMFEKKFKLKHIEELPRFEKVDETIASYEKNIKSIESRLDALPRANKIAALKKQIAELEKLDRRSK